MSSEEVDGGLSGYCIGLGSEEVVAASCRRKCAVDELLVMMAVGAVRLAGLAVYTVKAELGLYMECLSLCSSSRSCHGGDRGAVIEKESF